MSITVETCGKAYCEHYPDGLFTCAKCREESTIAHDKACAKIAEAQAEIERLDHQRRAGWTEIKRLKGEHEKSLGRAKNYILKLNAEIERKDKLIEQMREALKAVVSSAPRSGPLWHGSAEIEKAIAAIKAAERGE